MQKKSLISTLKTTKKANVASSELNAKPSTVASKARHADLKRANGLLRRQAAELKRKR